MTVCEFSSWASFPYVHEIGSDPPIHQVVFYQSGIGTANLYDSVVDGTASMFLAIINAFGADSLSRCDWCYIRYEPCFAINMGLLSNVGLV